MWTYNYRAILMTPLRSVQFSHFWSILKTFKNVRILRSLVRACFFFALPSDIKASLKEIQNTLNGFSPNAAAYQNLQGALVQFEQVMTELQPVLRQLNEKPNSLVFGDEKAKDPIPVGGRK